MKKVLLVATVQSHIAQFHKPLIELLHRKGCIVDVAACDNLRLKKNLTLTEPNNIIDIPFSRSPFRLRNIKAYRKLKSLINSNNYDVIHCNTPVGGVLTRLAANKKRKNGDCKVVYEAHGFHFYKGAPKKNWFIWYPLEKFFSRLATMLIVINEMDYRLAKEKFRARDVQLIPGVGVNLNQFKVEKNICNLKQEYGLPKQARIVLSVGELNKNKNQKIIIKALKYLNDENIHYFLAGNGPLRKKLEKLAQKLKVNSQVHFLGYRRDLPSIYTQSDVFVLPSYREGLGLASIEAMSYGLPIITSNRHGINDYSKNNVSGFKYNPDDFKGFANGIKEIVYNEQMKRRMGEHNKVEAQRFSLETSIQRMEEIYNGLLGEEL